jgi:hypothetical protein
LKQRVDGKIPADSSHFESVELAAQFRYLDLVNCSTPRLDTNRPSKRRKISERNLLVEVIEEIYLLLGSQKASDFDGLCRVAGYITFAGFRLPSTNISQGLLRSSWHG